MWIVIDTNAFYEDLRLKKSFDLLFRNIENIHFSLRTPELVVQEVVNIYREQRQSHLSKMPSHAKELKLLTSLDINIAIQEENLANDLLEYEGYLRGKLLSNGEIVPLPNVTVQSIIDRDLARRRPFKENGVGFRDTLIWETILELVIRQEYDGLVFITNNTKDFVEGRGLHSDLIEDLESKGANLDSIRVFSSVQQFIDDMVNPALNEIVEIKDAIENGNYPDIDLHEIAEGYIWDLISGYSIDPECLPKFGEDNDDITISGGVSDYEVILDNLSVKRLSETELLIVVSYKLDCEIDVFVPKWDVYDPDFDELGFYVSDPDWNESYVLASITLPFIVTLRYVYSEQDNEVKSADILSAECFEKEE